MDVDQAHMPTSVRKGLTHETLVTHFKIKQTKKQKKTTKTKFTKFEFLIRLE